MHPDSDQAPAMTDEEVIAVLAELSERERWIISEMIRLILRDPSRTEQFEA